MSTGERLFTRAPTDSDAEIAESPDVVVWEVAMRVRAEAIHIDLTPQALEGEQAPCRLVVESEQLRAIFQELRGVLDMDTPRARMDAKAQPARAYAPWTEEADQDLAGKVADGWTVPDLATHFGRTRGAISSRIERLTLSGFIPPDGGVDHG